jgi:hypothetical protein
MMRISSGARRIPSTLLSRTVPRRFCVASSWAWAAAMLPLASRSKSTAASRKRSV